MRPHPAPWLSALALFALCVNCGASTLTPARLGVIFNLDDPASSRLAIDYAAARAIPAGNLIGLHMPASAVITPAQFAPLRAVLLSKLSTQIQSLVLVWSRPFAVGCMSITTAFAAGYRAEFCEPGCAVTAPNPLFDANGWLPADTVGWWPAMLLPSDDAVLARQLIARGLAAGHDTRRAAVYLIDTNDVARNVRAAGYAAVEAVVAGRARAERLHVPVTRDLPDAMAYFTGATQVQELARIQFLPGAVADHLTSTGGILFGGDQMSALAWLRQGASASYGTVSEPCSHVGKFPDPKVLLQHYLHGETALEAYWKSVAMPGQGLFVGEPLARPFPMTNP